MGGEFSTYGQSMERVELRLDAVSGQLDIGTGSYPSWLGTGRPVDSAVHRAALDTGVTLVDHGAVVQLTVQEDLDGLQGGGFDQPLLGWNFRPDQRAAGDAPPGLSALGYQYTEFCLPVRAGAELAVWTLMPWRPAVVAPLLLSAADGTTLLLGPLDSFHDQIISVPTSADLGRGISWGFHGDLQSIPAGTTASLAVLVGTGATAVIGHYRNLLAERQAVAGQRPTDALGERVSYWTDNGAAYWYRTEGGRSVTETLVETVEDLRERRIPVDVVQLDSWFYPHEVLRPFDTDDWIVPPTGLLEWEPRPDILPEGLEALAAALGNPPLATHCRHLSSASPLTQRFECWIDADRAHPVGPELYAFWLDRARSWGVQTFEHDWLIECYLGVRGLRAEPGRAERWQRDINRLAAERDMTLQWCMASPADLLLAASLEQVTSIRTSGDHGYLVGPGFLWNWFLVVNALARPLGLTPFKDVFWSCGTDPAHHSELEAALATLSVGPVGIGDRLGTADRDLVLRTCLSDGTIVRPDVPIAATDRTLRDGVDQDGLLVGTTWVDHPLGRYGIVLSINTDDQPGANRRQDTLRAADLGEALDTGLGAGPVVVWDWRRGTADPATQAADVSWSVDLAPHDWDLRIVVPVSTGGVALVGDTGRFASVGRALVGDLVETADGVTGRLAEAATLTVCQDGELRRLELPAGDFRI